MCEKFPRKIFFKHKLFSTNKWSLSLNSYSLLYDSLFPLTQPEVVEKLVGLREGIPKKDAKEVSYLHLFFNFTTIYLFIYLYLVECCELRYGWQVNNSSLHRIIILKMYALVITGHTRVQRNIWEFTCGWTPSNERYCFPKGEVLTNFQSIYLAKFWLVQLPTRRHYSVRITTAFIFFTLFLSKS